MELSGAIGPRGLAANEIISAKRLHGQTADFVRVIFLAEPPIRNDTQLAAKVGLRLEQVRSIWATAFQGTPRATLHSLLEWSRHLYAVHAVEDGEKVIAVAHQLGVDVRTIERAAKSLTGATFSQCVKVGSGAGVRQLVRMVQGYRE